MAMPELVPWPAMPVLATLPVMLSVSCDRSMPLTVGAMPLISCRRRVVAELELVEHRRREDALQGHDARSPGSPSMCDGRPVTPSGWSLLPLSRK